MKINAKRIISFVLSCVLICSGVQSVMAEKTEKSKKLDVAKNLLSALHIIEDDSDSIVTREQFADIYVRANNMYQEGYVGQNPFDDTEDSEYTASIELMRDYGYINGVGNNCFAPTEYMLTRDIAKLYVSALGLDTYVAATGKNHMEVAYEVDLFDGVGISDYITMNSLILMTYNFLKAPVGVHNFTQQPSYSINNKTDALYEKFGIFKIKGQVTQSELSSLWSSAGASDGYVTIMTEDGEVIALSGESGIGSMLGHTLDIYIYDGEDGYRVICYEQRDNEETVVINIKNIDFDKSNNSIIHYKKEGRSSTTSERLAAFPSFVINGVYYDAGQFNIRDLRNYSGEMKLISSNRSDFDVVIINAYTNYFIKNVEHYDGEMRIYDSGSNGTLVLNESVYRKMEIFHPNGALASPFELQAGMLITVAKSFGTDIYVSVQICDSIMDGTVIDYDLDDRILVLSDGSKIEYSPSFSAANMSVGTLGRLYLDKFGDVAWIDYDRTATYSYGYMIKPRIDYGENKILARVVVESGKFSTLYVCDKPIIDGMRVKNVDAQLSELTSVDKIPNLPAGEYPFRYRLNEAGEITEIDTPSIRGGYEDRYSFRTTTSGASVICSNDRILGKETALSETTVMFLIPDATATEERIDPSFYTIGNRSLVNTGGDNTYTAFKIGNDSLCADLVIRTQTSIGGGMNHDNVLFLVEKVQNVYDAKREEIRTKVFGLEGGVEREYFVHDQFNKSKLDGIGKGDVLRFNLYSGEIAAMDKVFIYNDDTSTNTGKYHLPSGGQKASSLNQIGTSYYYAGYVMRREGRLIEILPFDLSAGSQDTGTDVPNNPDWSVETRRVFEAPTSISVYDPSLGNKECVYIGDLEDIPTYEDGGHYAKVIVRYRSRSAREMIVLKDESLFRNLR